MYLEIKTSKKQIKNHNKRKTTTTKPNNKKNKINKIKKFELLKIDFKITDMSMYGEIGKEKKFKTLLQI